MSASHNPGGPNEDFGIKFNGANGGPSVESVTEEIFNQSKIISEYLMIEDYEPLDFSAINDYNMGECSVHVVSNVDYYVEYMQSLFDFNQI